MSIPPTFKQDETLLTIVLPFPYLSRTRRGQNNLSKAEAAVRMLRWAIVSQIPNVISSSFRKPNGGILLAPVQNARISSTSNVHSTACGE